MALTQNSPIPSDIRVQRVPSTRLPNKPTRKPVESPFFSQSPPVSPKKNSSNSFLGILIILILVAVVFGLYFLGLRHPSAKSTTATSTPEATKDITTPPVSSSDNVTTIEQELNATIIDDSDISELDREFE